MINIINFLLIIRKFEVLYFSLNFRERNRSEFLKFSYRGIGVSSELCETRFCKAKYQECRHEDLDIKKC